MLIIWPLWLLYTNMDSHWDPIFWKAILIPVHKRDAINEHHLDHFKGTNHRTLSRSAANFKTLFETINSSLLWGFCSIYVGGSEYLENWIFFIRQIDWRIHTNKYKLICSVIKTEMLRYFRLIFVPSVMKRNRKQPNAHDQISASSMCCDCNWTESFNHSTLKNASSNSVKINAPETITSTERCGPRLCVRKTRN